MFRYVRVVGGNHVDGLVDVFPGQLRPIAPCFQDAVDALTGVGGQDICPPEALIAQR